MQQMMQPFMQGGAMMGMLPKGDPNAPFKAGLAQYEVSNFARPRARCRHNETYWDLRPWEAFGPGAARFLGSTRTTNHRSPFTWMKRLSEGLDPAAERECMTTEEAARERIVLGLRRRAKPGRCVRHVSGSL